ncbi:UNVERIFIED_CONTAM: hypothetical protein K2H54_064542 [Gekko kuhli]
MKTHKPQDNWTLDVAEALNISPRGWYQYEQRHLFARFKCSGCSKRWNSAQSVILFHFRLEKRWGLRRGQAKMWMFRQKCRRCTTARYEEPVFSEKALETILYNLALRILEKSYGEPKGRPRHCDIEETVEGPHDERHCEACEHGMCIEIHTSCPTATPTSQAPFIEWRENLKRSAFHAPPTECRSNIVGPQPTVVEECLRILLVVIVIACLLFCAFLFKMW